MLPLFVFALFAVSVLVSLVLGARAYNLLSERDDASFTYRTAAQYISVKIKQTENRETIKTEPFGDGTAIVLGSSYDGIKYTTKLYVYDGQLYELFSPEGLEMQPSDGQSILPLESLFASADKGMLEIVLKFSQGESQKLYIDLLAGEGENEE